MTAIVVSFPAVSLLVGGKQQLSVDATYNDGSHKDVTSATAWTDSNQAVAMIDNAGLVSALFAGTATITAKDGSFSATTTVTVNGANITTWHGDNQRTGLNPNEGILTTANVNPQNFGKLFSYFVDGYIYAQPLYVSNLTINGSAHNVVFAATESEISPRLRGPLFSFLQSMLFSSKPACEKTNLLAPESVVISNFPFSLV